MVLCVLVRLVQRDPVQSGCAESDSSSDKHSGRRDVQEPKKRPEKKSAISIVDRRNASER